MRRPFKHHVPQIHPSAWIEGSADVIGEVILEADTSVWCGAVVRGDVGLIRVGPRSNIQDNCVVHCTRGLSTTTIGTGVTIGHGAIIHGCTVEDGALIGMGSIILDNAVIPTHALVGAGTLITQGQTFPPGHLILGRPGRAVRPLTEEEVANVIGTAQHYLDYVAEHRATANSRQQTG